MNLQGSYTNDGVSSHPCLLTALLPVTSDGQSTFHELLDHTLKMGTCWQEGPRLPKVGDSCRVISGHERADPGLQARIKMVGREAQRRVEHLSRLVDTWRAQLDQSAPEVEVRLPEHPGHVWVARGLLWQVGLHTQRNAHKVGSLLEALCVAEMMSSLEAVHCIR